MASSDADNVVVIGPNDQTQPGGEADLDIQYIMAMAPKAKTTFWSIGANSTVEIDDILKWAMAMANATDPPQVTSISYGMTEAHVDQFLGVGYLKRSDVEFAKLAALGLTVIIASGDTGAGDLGAPPMSNPTCSRVTPLASDVLFCFVLNRVRASDVARRLAESVALCDEHRLDVHHAV